MQQRGKTSVPRFIWLILGILTTLAIFGVCGASLYRQQFDILARNLQPSCTIGLFGATITVQGWSANSDCQQMLDGQDDNFTGVNWLKHGATPASPTDGTIACEYDISGRHVTVRYGVTTNEGNFACDLLNPIYPLPTP